MADIEWTEPADFGDTWHKAECNGFAVEACPAIFTTGYIWYVGQKFTVDGQIGYDPICDGPADSLEEAKARAINYARRLTTRRDTSTYTIDESDRDPIAANPRGWDVAG